MYRLFLALRYLLTRPINILGMLGVTLGVWALIVVVSIFSGFIAVVTEHIRSAGADLSLLARDGADSPFERERPAQPLDEHKLRELLEADPDVAGTAPRLVHFGLVHRRGHRPPPPPLLGRSALQGGDVPFLFVLGIDPAREATATGFRSWLQVRDPALAVADPDDPLRRIDDLPTMLLGEERMRAEGLKPGDKVVLTTGRVAAGNVAATAIEPLHVEFAVAGAYRTRHGGFDGNNLLVDLVTLGKLLRPDQAHPVQELSIRLHPGADLTAARNRIAELARQAAGTRPGETGPVVRTWRERNQSLLQSVEHQRALMKIVLIVIMVVAAFLMYATLSMMVAEKTGDIGILTAMGGSAFGIMQVFLSCGVAITLAGVLLGTVTGCLSAIYLEEFRQFVLGLTGVDLFPLKVYNLDRVPHELDPVWIAQVAAMAMLIGALVSALPALRAARHDPLVSLRGA
ncbi:MAG: ABC transporter permease [Planctomycetes bacterium]|nr:ABC transporter permease [Planctomycetota bacterium]